MLLLLLLVSTSYDLLSTYFIRLRLNLHCELFFLCLKKSFSLFFDSLCLGTTCLTREHCLHRRKDEIWCEPDKKARISLETNLIRITRISLEPIFLLNDMFVRCFWCWKLFFFSLLTCYEHARKHRNEFRWHHWIIVIVTFLRIHIEFLSSNWHLLIFIGMFAVFL